MEKKVIEDNAYELIRKYGSDILASPTFRSLAKNKQHHNSTTYAHLIQVTVLAIKFCRKHHWKVDEKALVRAALLHDYYLYDWHDKPHRKKRHARRHAVYAADNAERDFGLSPFERQLILYHMWPINPLHWPRCKEAWAILWADKKATFRELTKRLSTSDHYAKK